MTSNQYFVVCHSRQAPPACRRLLRLFGVAQVTLLIRMWNVDQSYNSMLIILNLKLSRIAGQIASRMKYSHNAEKFAKRGTITQNA